jgi:hypothetical protein
MTRLDEQTHSSTGGWPNRDREGTTWRRFLLIADAHPAFLLAALAVVVAIAHATSVAASWHYFALAGRLIVSPIALHTYSLHPELQFGPLTALVAAPFAALPDGVGVTAAVIAMILLGVAALAHLHRIVGPHDARTRTAWWISAVIVTIGWGEVAVRYGHLDDAVALYLLVLAVRLFTSRHPFASAIALALCVDAKPWALPFVILLLLNERRLWVPLLATWSALVTVAWAPFFLADPQTLRAMHFTIAVEPASTLALFHVPSVVTPPWCRPAQLVVALALAGIAVAFRKWAPAILAVFVTRLMLDPSVKSYYDVELLIACALCDLTIGRSRVPWLTVIGAATVYIPSYALTASPVAHAVVRTAGLAAILVLAVVQNLRPSAPSGGIARSLMKHRLSRLPIGHIRPVMGAERRWS